MQGSTVRFGSLAPELEFEENEVKKYAELGSPIHCMYWVGMYLPKALKQLATQ